MSLKQILGLSFSLAKANFKLRNEGSYLGIFWYLLNPLLMFGLLLFIFSNNLGVNIPNYPLYLLLGIVMFNFFKRTTTESTEIIHSHAGVIKSIRFPRESLIIATVFRNLFSHLFEIMLIILFLLIFSVPLTGILFYIMLLFFFFIFILGFSLILSSLTVYFIDLKNVWLFASTLLWFGTPIFYAIEGSRKLLLINLFNPLYYFISIGRDIIIYSKIPELWMILIGIAYGLLFLLIGLIIFNKLKTKFAELI